MKEELLQRLDALAEKLGTTAEYLWGVMVAWVVRPEDIG